MVNRNISDKRKTAFYLGTVISGIGLLLFASSFLIVAVAILSQNPKIGAGMVITGPLGFFGIVVGQFIRRIGSQGLAGSGILLDPVQAREDIEPWSRMSGGVIKDTLDEAGLDLAKLTANIGNSSNDTELPFDEKLRRLHKLHEDGILSDAEYQQEKAELLANN